MKTKTLSLITILLALIVITSAILFLSTYNDRGQLAIPSTEEAFRDVPPSAASGESLADAILSNMTVEEKVGQMFMGCFYSGTPDPETIKKYHLGGVTLFAQTFKDAPPEKLTRQLAALKAESGVVPLISVDEEGGTVVRASSSKLYREKPFSSPRALFAKGGLDAIVADTHEKNKLLKSLGIDMNLAPVCDISQDEDDFMYDRSLGQDAQTTAQFAEAVVKACIEDGMGSCLKHFPGYGNSEDTHEGLAVDTRSRSQLENNDLIPFEAGIAAGAHSVLVSHNIISSIDSERPASLSPAVHQILRDELDYDGVIITDDLSMGAITKFSPSENAAVTAIHAGNDILCTGDFETQYQAVLKAVKDGDISEERIDNSVRRILQLKIDLGLLS